MGIQTAAETSMPHDYAFGDAVTVWVERRVSDAFEWKLAGIAFKGMVVGGNGIDEVDAGLAVNIMPDEPVPANDMHGTRHPRVIALAGSEFSYLKEDDSKVFGRFTVSKTAQLVH